MSDPLWSRMRFHFTAFLGKLGEWDILTDQEFARVLFLGIQRLQDENIRLSGVLRDVRLAVGVSGE